MAAWRAIRIFVLQFLVLLICARLIGNPIMSAYGYLTSPAACIGFVVDYRYLLGTCFAAILMAYLLDRFDARRRTVYSFMIVIILVDLFFATDLKQSFCS